MDFATSADPAVQAQLDRLAKLSPGGDQLGLDRISRLLDRLGRPQDHLPPVFHVAGTNGKGSTCAFLRAGLEAAGHRVHAFTSPHLVRFNERIRLAGSLIEDDLLAALLEVVLDHSAAIEPSFFEVATATAFLAFSRLPAEACIIEVGLGGRLDSTNVIDRPAVCGIAALGIDHQQFLGSDPLGIAREKAAIARPGVPLVVSAYPGDVLDAVQEVAEARNAPFYPAGSSWRFRAHGGRLHYRDRIGELAVPLPALAGEHQHDNCALAIAMLRHQRAVAVPPEAFRRMPVEARWPARLQRLGDGPLRRMAGEVWVDGGHNPDAARRIARWIGERGEEKPLLVIGLLANKDARGFLEPFAATGCAMVAVPVAGHESHDPEDLAKLALELGFPAAGAAPGLADALDGARGSPVAILGSLYLAGQALEANAEFPD